MREGLSWDFSPSGSLRRLCIAYCGGTMSWIPGCSSKPIWDAFKWGTIRILRDQSEFLQGSIGINQNILWTLCCMFYVKHWFEIEYSDVSVGGSTAILSHPTPFCFQIARYTETEGLFRDYVQQSKNIYLFFINSAVFS